MARTKETIKNVAMIERLKVSTSALRQACMLKLGTFKYTKRLLS